MRTLWKAVPLLFGFDRELQTVILDQFTGEPREGEPLDLDKAELLREPGRDDSPVRARIDLRGKVACDCCPAGRRKDREDERGRRVFVRVPVREGHGYPRRAIRGEPSRGTGSG